MIVVEHGQDNSSTHKWIARKDGDQVRTAAGAWVTWDDDDFADYGLTATRLGTTTAYTGTLPDDTEVYELWLWTGTLSTSYLVGGPNPVDVRVSYVGRREA
jgi:hypothetical protein